jgi:hypothetical protein
VGGQEVQPNNKSSLFAAYTMSGMLQGRLRFIYPLEAAKARLLMDGSGGTFPGERESGETVQPARMAARCWGLQ